MTTIAQLRREIEIISHALNTDKPKPNSNPADIIPLEAFTETERMTILKSEEILTDHERHPRASYFNIHTVEPNTNTEEYSDTEKETILAAYHLVTNYHATHTQPDTTPHRSLN